MIRGFGVDCEKEWRLFVTMLANRFYRKCWNTLQTTRDRNKSDKWSNSPFLKNKIQNNDTTIWLKVKDFSTCTQVIWGHKLRSPSWIIGPRVLLKHSRQWNRTKCIYVTIGDLCELFRAGTTPVTSGRRGRNGKWEYEGTVHAHVYTRCYVKKNLLSFFTRI